MDVISTIAFLVINIVIWFVVYFIVEWGNK